MQTATDFTTGYKLELDEYGFPNQYCYWLKMGHPKDGSPDWQTLFDYYVKKMHWAKWIRPGMTCIDIGGHSGDTAIPMMVYSKGTVLTVEPNPVIRPFLEYNCAINNHLGKFVIAWEAVTNKNTDNLTFADHQNLMCNGGILDENWSETTKHNVDSFKGHTITVSGLTLETMLDKYLTKDEIDKIGFIKTDTEGHDAEIIRNSRDILLKYKPVLFTEWFDAYGLDDSIKLFETIEDCGYVAFDPETMEEVYPDINKPKISDLLCLHKDNL